MPQAYSCQGSAHRWRCTDTLVHRTAKVAKAKYGHIIICLDIFAITNYGVTIFCVCKFRNAVDKHVWASLPTPWNGMALPPGPALMHFTAVGQPLFVNSVPCTPSSGFPLPLDAAHTLQLNTAWWRISNPCTAFMSSQATEGSGNCTASRLWVRLSAAHYCCRNRPHYNNRCASSLEQSIASEFCGSCCRSAALVARAKRST